MKTATKLLAFVMICVIVAASFAACSEKRILIIDDDTNSSMSSGVSDVTSNDDDAVEPSSETSEESLDPSEKVNGTYGNETMPDNIYVPQDTIVIEETRVVYGYNDIVVDNLIFDELKNTVIGHLTFKLINNDTEFAVAACSNNASVIIPSSINSIPVTQIYDEGFKARFIPDIVIPKTVKSIGIAAFSGGDYKPLNAVYYEGTAEEWRSISIDSWANDRLIKAPKFYYSDTEPTEEGNYWRYVDGVPTVW